MNSEKDGVEAPIEGRLPGIILHVSGPIEENGISARDFADLRGELSKLEGRQSDIETLLKRIQNGAGAILLVVLSVVLAEYWTSIVAFFKDS